jgi:hypothetical protein
LSAIRRIWIARALGRVVSRGIAVKLTLAATIALLCVLLFSGLLLVSSGRAGDSGGCRVKPAGDEVPANYVPWLVRATERYRLGPRGYSIIAAVHLIESNFGRSTLPGVASGANHAGAAGPGQFLAATWAAYGVDADGDGSRDVYSVPDSVFGTANYLHASGAPGNWHDALFAYNHAEWYVEDVEAEAAKIGSEVEVVCATLSPSGGSAALRQFQTLNQPRTFKSVPARLWVGFGTPQQVDARIWPNLVWLLDSYGLRVTAARESGHSTHGDGTAVDLVPASGSGWDESALRAAEDLGWRGPCGGSGTAPVCPLVPAIQFVGYNGYPMHGDPAHAGGNAHLHISWRSSSFGSAALSPPPRWVRVFPLGS